MKFPFKIAGQILDHTGTISADGEDTERIAGSVRSVRSIKTLPFIGEFGVPAFCR